LKRLYLKFFRSYALYANKLLKSTLSPLLPFFTDAELASIAKLESITPKTLLTINGIGDKRVEKDVKILCEMSLPL
jgi:hypothetical protein